MPEAPDWGQQEQERPHRVHQPEAEVRYCGCVPIFWGLPKPYMWRGAFLSSPGAERSWREGLGKEVFGKPVEQPRNLVLLMDSSYFNQSNKLRGHSRQEYKIILPVSLPGGGHDQLLGGVWRMEWWLSWAARGEIGDTNKFPSRFFLTYFPSLILRCIPKWIKYQSI